MPDALFYILLGSMCLILVVSALGSLFLTPHLGRILYKKLTSALYYENSDDLKTGVFLIVLCYIGFCLSAILISFTLYLISFCVAYFIYTIAGPNSVYVGMFIGGGYIYWVSFLIIPVTIGTAWFESTKNLSKASLQLISYMITMLLVLLYIAAFYIFDLTL